MRYFLELAYNGTAFHGWQIQPNANSVQSTVEQGLSTILRENVCITGAGRTDTGVHARQMFAHFDSDLEITDVKRFLQSLNSLVGKNISILNLFQISENAHARFDALERTYKYFVTFSKNPFLNQFSWHSPSFLDFDKMNEAALVLLETNDFTSFAKLHSDTKTNFCDVKKAYWQPIQQDYEALNFIGNINNGFVFTISADRFLRNMVRAIVGTLVEVGRGKLNLNQFQNVIDNKNRCLAGNSMPANALFLWQIKYPFIQETLKS